MNYHSYYIYNRSWRLLYKLLSSHIVFLLSRQASQFKYANFPNFQTVCYPSNFIWWQISFWKTNPWSQNITFTHIATSYGRRLITSHISSPIAGFAGNSWRDGSKQFPKASWILKWASFRYVFGSFQSFSWGIPVDSLEA